MKNAGSGGEGNDSPPGAECADRGQAHWKQGNYTEALEWFTRALVSNPDDAWVLMRRGAARGAISDVAGAAADLNRARALRQGESERGRRQWASAQLGEALRASVRDLALGPAANPIGAEALLSRLNASSEAFSEALRDAPDSAWVYAHRGAARMLAHWVGLRVGMAQEQVQRYAEEAWSDLDTAVRLNGGYAWAVVFQAFLLTVMGSNQEDTAERHAFFARAAECIEKAGRVDEAGTLVTLRPLAELALYRQNYDKVVELGWAQLSREPDDVITRYCVAESLLQRSRKSEADAPAVEQVRQEAADAVAEQTRRALLAKRSRSCAMLGGLAMLQGQPDVAAAMLEDVLEYPDMDTLVFIRCDPAWDPVREAVAAAKNVPSWDTVIAVYLKLFPPSN